MAKMRKSSKDVKRLRNAIASAKRTATKARNMGQDVIFNDIRSIKDFTDRKEFIKYLRMIQKFNKQNRFLKNQYGVVFNRNDIEQANKLIDKQNKQRIKNRRLLRNLKETQGGIATPISVLKETNQGFQDSSNVFTPVRHVNIQTYHKKSQLDKRLQALKRNNKKYNREIQFQKNYKKGLGEQVRQGTLTKKQYNQMIRDINKLSPVQFSIWYQQEAVTKSAFNYIDITSVGNLSENQRSIMQQYQLGLKSDFDMIQDSLAIKSGRAVVKDGVVVYK